MANSFYLNIVTGDKVVFQGNVVSLLVPAEGGYLGVLANHAPLVANLIKGKITFKDELSKEIIFQLQSKGLLEVIKNKATILADSLEPFLIFPFP